VVSAADPYGRNLGFLDRKKNNLFNPTDNFNFFITLLFDLKGFFYKDGSHILDNLAAIE
jgi:hypothetical protein